MFDADFLVRELENNIVVFEKLFSGLKREQINFRPAPEKWNLLEIICHLYDEEREDFRTRLIHVLNNPDLPLPSIDPQGWVTSRNYNEQDFDVTLKKFLNERRESVGILKSLQSPDWSRAYMHPKFGPMSGKLFLSNWIAHDYLHIRQVLYTKHNWLKMQTGEDLKYAGDW